MKLKRICTFLIMVFILSGCMSDVPVSNANMSFGDAGELTHRNSAQLMAKKLEENQTIKQEVQAYASKNTNKKLIQQVFVQDVLQEVKEKSDASKYHSPKKEPEKPVEQKPADNVETASVVDDANIFYPRTTLYGVDCYGCNVREDGTGNTAIGVMLNPNLGVMQSDGTWKEGLTYDGYYIIAADPSIPFYSIIEISNHGLSGMGFSPDVPIQAMVLDRGGGIKGAHLDLYIGSETFIGNISISGSQPVAKILRYGK